MPQATPADAELILRLYELRRDDKLREARDWFVKNFRAKSMAEFQQLCPVGSGSNAYFRMVTSYWEMVASFITSGVLNPELFFQSGREMLLVFERVRPIVPEIREAYKDSQVWRNLEIAAEQYVQFLGTGGPDAYKAFVGRVG